MLLGESASQGRVSRPPNRAFSQKHAYVVYDHDWSENGELGSCGVQTEYYLN